MTIMVSINDGQLMSRCLVTSSSGGRLISRYPSLLGATSTTGNLTSDIHKYMQTLTNIGLSSYNHETHRLKLIKYIIKHIHINKYSSSKPYMFRTQYNFPIYKLIHLLTSIKFLKFLMSFHLLCSSLLYIIT
jgi:hypothetical protein